MTALTSIFHRALVDTPGIFGAVLSRTLEAANTWHKRYVQRRELSNLDAHMLRDIGITPEQARHEAQKPFWVG
jgi:uncharacterized protein YjiS (DUF1127 family)